MSGNSSSATCAVLVHNAHDTILDWISWHLALGFQRILVVDNGSDDGTEEIVHSLTETHPVEWHAPERNEQHTPEERRLFLTRYALQTLADFSKTRQPPHWSGVFDVDEYLEPEPDLSTLLERGHNATAIMLNWCIFGSSGHQWKPRGHIVATHTWRADQSLSDHRMARLLVKTDRLPPLDSISDPLSLNIPPHDVIHPDGQQLLCNEPDTHWQGGRILHYIYTKRTKAVSMPHALQRHFDRNDIEDFAPQRFLHAVRHVQNTVWRSSLEYSIDRLHEWATEHATENIPLISTPDLNLPDTAQRINFRYERIRPTRRNRLLLSPQATPPYGITHLFTLQDSTTGYSLTEDQSPHAHTNPEPLIGMVQEHYPRLLSLFRKDGQSFILGDVPCPHGMAIMLTRRTHQTHLFTLPAESGHSGIIFKAVPYHNLPAPEITPLPLPDESTGLSLQGLMLWIENHPCATPQDFYRTLRLLNNPASMLLQQVIPGLQPFLP